MIAAVFLAGIAGGPVDDVELGIIAAGEPGWRTAVIDVLALPGLRTRLAPFRYGPEPPQFLAAVLIEGGDEPVGAMFATGNSGDNEVAGGKRSRSGEVVLVPVRDLRVPEKIASKSIQRDDVGVIGLHENAAAGHSYAAVVSGIANHTLCPGPLVMPELAAGPGIQRVALVGGRHVHDAVHHH